MAIVLTDKESFDFWISLVKVAIGLSAIAIIGVFIFWLRLNNIEKYLQKYIYRRKRALRPKLIQQPISKTRIKTQVVVSKSPNSLTNFRKRQAQGYTKVNYPIPTKQTLKKAGRWRWLLAVLVASVTGTAIAFVQWSSIFLSPQSTTLIWFCIGIFLVFSATYAL